MNEVLSINRNGLTADSLRKLFEYDQSTGLFTWKDFPRKGVRANGKAGYKNPDGYIQIGINGFVYMAHRLAWLISFGSWPEMMIDHINGNREDNRICNLRDVDLVTNSQNRRLDSAWGKSKILGAQWNEKKNCWQSAIKPRNCKRVFLGLFDTPEAAHDAYVLAKHEMHSSEAMDGLQNVKSVV